MGKEWATNNTPTGILSAYVESTAPVMTVMLLIEKTGPRSPIGSEGLRQFVCILKDLASAFVLSPCYSWCPISGRGNKRKFREEMK